MKAFLIVVVVLFLGSLFYFRQRIFVRDPLATVFRSDERQPDAEVFINYSNDVLLMENDYRGAHNTLVQDWNRVPGTPTHLTCIRWMACFTEASRASTIPLVDTGDPEPLSGSADYRGGKGKYDPRVFMTGHEVSYIDGNGAAVRITLR